MNAQCDGFTLNALFSPLNITTGVGKRSTVSSVHISTVWEPNRLQGEQASRYGCLMSGSNLASADGAAEKRKEVCNLHARVSTHGQ